MANQKHDERRQHERVEVHRTAVISYEGHKTTVETIDLSNVGAFLQRGNSPLPTEGSKIFVDIAPDSPDEEPMIAEAKVVRVTESGIGIVFIG